MSSTSDEAPKPAQAAHPNYQLDYFRIEEQDELDGRLRLMLIGELDLAARHLMHDRLAGPRRSHVVIDLSHVTFIDAAGLSVLLLVLRQSESNIELAREVSPQAARLIGLAQVEELLWPPHSA